MSHPAEFIKSLGKRETADIVIASRYVPGGYPISRGFGTHSVEF